MQSKGGDFLKKFLKVFTLITFISIGLIVVLLLLFNRGMIEIKNLEISEINISKLHAQRYLGEYKNGRWEYSVEIILNNGRIEKVNILNDRCGPVQMEFYKEINEKIVDRVLNKQSLKVDIVTGATVNSKAFLKAIENALKKGGIE